MDGLTVLSELRNKRKDTYVLISSAKDQIEDRIARLNSGAGDYAQLQITNIRSELEQSDLHSFLIVCGAKVNPVLLPSILA